MSLWEKLFGNSASEIPRITPKSEAPLWQPPSPQERALPAAAVTATSPPAAKRAPSGNEQLRDRLEALKADELMCLTCEKVQAKGAWEKRKDDEAKAAGRRGFVNLSAKAQCLRCGSSDMAGPKWSGYLFSDQAEEFYYKKMRELGVKADWVKEA
jgi:hypothetical protein